MKFVSEANGIGREYIFPYFSAHRLFTHFSAAVLINVRILFVMLTHSELQCRQQPRCLSCYLKYFSAIQQNKICAESVLTSSGMERLSPNFFTTSKKMIFSHVRSSSYYFFYFTEQFFYFTELFYSFSFFSFSFFHINLMISLKFCSFNIVSCS